jgi:chemotaxis protein histidine kinase CheA
MVFSLSMLDVFCCALGCVTLLWLINQREAMLRLRDASSLTANLDTTRSELKKLQTEYAGAVTERDRQADSAKQLRSQLDSVTADADRLSRALTAADQKVEQQESQFAKAQSEIQVLTRQMSEARARSSDMEKQLHEEEALAAAAERKATELASKLRTAIEQAAELRQASAASGDKLAASQERITKLEAELDTARRMVVGVDSEKKDLASRLARAQAAAENRFEGITLAGKRVIFLVDMSGSMELVDAQTTAPQKWTGVCATLVKVLRSLPDVEKFQVIMFSDQLQYPLGNEGRWIEFDGNVADRLQSALATTKPRGNTNMYLALDAAFRYRTQGLDTIYLLSDGLPNIGEGLTPESAARMTESQRSELLSRVIRTALRTNWNAPQSGRPRVRINTIGFFYESPEVGAFLWALSRENDGSFVGMSKP